MAEFLQFFFSGLTVGAVYALVALGFTLIYNASDIINFAQGEFVMLGGMTTVFFAAVLFFAGISMRFVWERIRIAVLALGTVFLVYALVLVARLPIH